MKQHEFMYTAKSLTLDVQQDEVGNTIATLRPYIHLMHSYKKNDLMQIIFLEDQARYIIPSNDELEEIYRLHLELTDLTQVLREYCDKHLKRM